MIKQVGFYEYAISPYHLKVFKGLFNPGAASFIKRIAPQLVFSVPPLLTFYFLASWADKKVKPILSKNKRVIINATLLGSMSIITARFTNWAARLQSIDLLFFIQ